MREYYQNDIPNFPNYCPKVVCVYNSDDICVDPRKNSWYTDAKCFAWETRFIIDMLKEHNKGFLY